MDIKRMILNYLIEKNRPYSVEDLSIFFDVDSFLVQQFLDELENNLEVKKIRDKYIYSDYKLGTVEFTQKGKAYIENSGNIIWISSNKLNGAYKGDIVLVNVLRSRGTNIEGEVVLVKEHHKEVNEGTVINIDGEHFIKPDDKSYLVSVGDYLVDGERVVYNKGKLIRNNLYSGSIVSHIGNTDDTDIDSLNCLVKYHVTVPFKSETLSEVSLLPTEVSVEDIKNRVDLRNEEIFTIDGDDAKDLDDAVSLKMLDNGNYLVRVSIADVSHYVKKGSAIDLDAHERGTSVYYPGHVVPMLPHELSSGICSLFGGVDRLAMTCEMEIDKNGNVVNYKIYESVINSKKRMTYNKVNKVLNGETPEDYKSFERTLLKMNELKQVLHNKRICNGSIEFEMPEVVVEVDKDGNTIDVHKNFRGEAERLVEELMLIANTTVSTHLTNTGYPSIYRVHEKPDMMKINNVIKIMREHGEQVVQINDSSSSSIKMLLDSIASSPNREIYTKLILFCMSKAVYDVDNCGHYGLSFDDYTHFTSPIRRYPDLTVHRLLKEYMNKKKSDSYFFKQQKMYLDETAKHSSYKEKNADKCERDIKKSKMASFLSNHIGETYEGNILEFGRYGMIIQLYSGIVGLISFNDIPCPIVDNKKMIVKTPYKIYHLGDNLTVEVASTNIKKGEIKFKEKVLKK